MWDNRFYMILLACHVLWAKEKTWIIAYDDVSYNGNKDMTLEFLFFSFFALLYANNNGSHFFYRSFHADVAE